ncbi:MAG: helix-turn-helix transcriptional regulator [Planctomycetota bacterium]
MKTNKLAETIRREFAIRGWSMNELAKRTGLPYSVVHRFFSAGENNADLKTVEKWCAALNLELRATSKINRK